MKNVKGTVLICSMILLGQSKLAYGQKSEVQTILSDVKLDSLTQFVKQLSGEQLVVIEGKTDTIKTRFSYGNGNEKAYKYMRALFTQYGLVVDSFIFSANGKNLFGIKKGYKHPDKQFMIGAHYDNAGSWARAPGADDNASGTAAVLEAARVFSKYSFPYTIVFALWDEEEQGSLGSKYYAVTINGRPNTFMGYINLDMLGWDGNNDTVADIHVMPTANSLQLADKAEKCNVLYNVGLKIHLVNPGRANTDHSAFWENNLTAIGVDEEYDNDFNPYWHTPADSIGHFNLDFFQRCAKLAYATLADCALDTVLTLSAPKKILGRTIMISPNPFQSYTSIAIDGASDLPIQIQVIDLLGRRIFESSTTSNNFRLEFPTSMTEGQYYLKLYDGEIVNTYKIIKY